MKYFSIWLMVFCSGIAPNIWAQPTTDPYKPQDFYDKLEYQIPMRDGVKLFTAIFIPKDRSQSYAFLVKKTPYSCSPYGAGKFPGILGPQGDHRFAKEGYIFVCQDVRGRWMSEGKFVNMTPHIDHKTGTKDVDESTDMYDTVEWLLKNVPNNNGRVGLHGISYPGFYVAASIIDTHPAIKAASPQAPIADWFVGDDFHHNGAFYLLDFLPFFPGFEHPEPNPTQRGGQRIDYGIKDHYTFYQRLGALPNANERILHHKVAYWDSVNAHANYDKFWQRSNLLPHLKNINTNVMTIYGAFDAEDPLGGTGIYNAIRKNNPNVSSNRLVFGPWFHGGWERSEGDYLNNVFFGQKTAVYYREQIDLAFFNYYLKDKGTFSQANVLAFSTGSNEWHNFDVWPPPALKPVSMYMRENGGLSMTKPPAAQGKDSYISDPAKPVPFTQEITENRTRDYMTEDQRFAARRPDVLVYQSEVLNEDLTFAGPITADLFVSTTGTDADFIVKVIDVFPDDMPETQAKKDKYMNIPLSGYQMMVRGEVFRGKYRQSFEKPVPFTPNRVTEVKWNTPDIFHTFKKGHRVMVQIQSTWFPLVDRNPQQFLNIYQAKDSDFKAQTHTIYRTGRYASSVTMGQLR
jgi:putative CocE/NonD family hydrolase